MKHTQSFKNAFLLLSLSTTLWSVESSPGKDPDMVYVSLPDSIPSNEGGRCMDGSMAGYYLRKGTNPDLFVIYLKGGGGCWTQEICDRRSTTSLGSSTKFSSSVVGTRFLDSDCTTNPDLCQATAIYVPYCTSDTHRGTNAAPSALSFGYYFDGHLNFQIIVNTLIAELGLGQAKHVMLTGTSAGAIGTLFNVDYLAGVLPNASVKAVPFAGWYTPGAMADDLPEIFAPSDYPHFAAGEHGNALYDIYQEDPEGAASDPWEMKSMLPLDCVAAQEENEWWVCQSIHTAYYYIQSPLFQVHTQYDSHQIFSQNGAPESPANDEEIETVKRYIEFWGNATRASLDMIFEDLHDAVKPHKDGLFSASCMTHGTSESTKIDGNGYMEIIHDWFFQNGQYEDVYRLMETCDPLEGDEGFTIPCNAEPACHYKRKNDGPRRPIETCAKALVDQGCIQSFGKKDECISCAKENRDAAQDAGCTAILVGKICDYAANNDIFDEWDGDVSGGSVFSHGLRGADP